jgi:hypothetical protein
MTFIAAGGALAASVGLTGLIGATAATAIGTAVVAGAAGAAIGAGGAALTGGDIGEGALMGGVGGAVTGGLGGLMAPGAGVAAGGVMNAGGGLSAAMSAVPTAAESAMGIGGGLGGGMGANVGMGAIAGAAGGAASSAAGGEDIGTGALMGGALGGIGGAFKNVPSAPQSSPLVKGANIPQSSGSAINNLGKSTAQIQAAANSTPTSSVIGGTTSTLGDKFQQGMNLITEHPGYALAGAGGLYLASQSGDQPTMPQIQEVNDPNAFPSMSPNYQPTINIPRSTVKQYYAKGGIVGYADGGLLDNLPGKGMVESLYNSGVGPSVAPGVGNTLFGSTDAATAAQPQAAPVEAPPVNKFYAQGLQLAQQVQAQQAQAQQDPAAAAPAPTPMQGTAPPLPQGTPAVAPSVQQPVQPAAKGGLMGDSNLGGYAHGGIPRLTRGPGDGVSDSIPAEIGDTGKQPARLADGEFVIPARIVSELGNGSTEAGARALQAMVDKIQHRRKKSIGKGKVAVDSKARKGLLA